MEGKNSPNLPSTSWRTGKTSDVIQSYSEGLRTRSADVQGQEKMDVPAQVESKFALPPLFCSIQALSGLDHSHLH